MATSFAHDAAPHLLAHHGPTMGSVFAQSARVRWDIQEALVRLQRRGQGHCAAYCLSSRTIAAPIGSPVRAS